MYSWRKGNGRGGEVCIRKYMWHVRINCCTYFTEGEIGGGRRGIMCECVCVGGRWGGEEEKYVDTCMICYICCVREIYVYKCKMEILDMS